MGKHTELERNIWTRVEEKIIIAIGKLVPQMQEESYEEYEKRIVYTADKALEVMCKELGGDRYYVPRLPPILRFRRDIMIKKLYNGGNLSYIADTTGISQRHLRRINRC